MQHYKENNAPRNCWFIVMCAIVALLIFLCNSCKVCEPVVITRDSVRVEFRDRIDSLVVYKHDSVFVSEKQKGDTVFLTIERIKTLWRDHNIFVHDTLTVNNNTSTVESVEVVPKFYKNCTIAFWVIIVSIILYIAARIVIKIYFHK